MSPVRDTGMTPTYLSPRQLARQLGVGPAKIIGWIRRGELRAINVATRLVGKPRYRISPAAVAQWEQGRSATPERQAKPRRRRRIQTEWY